MTDSPKEEVKVIDGPSQIIYADRILNIGFGHSVSRLVLGMEVQPNTYTPSYTVVVPTSALLDALSFMQTAVQDNPDLKEDLLKGLEVTVNQIKNL